MSASKDLEQILRAFTQKKGISAISRFNLEKYAAHWTQEFKRAKSDFTDFSALPSARFEELLQELFDNGTVETYTDERGAQHIVYLPFFSSFVREALLASENDMGSVFPSESFYNAKFPDSVVEEVDVKENFGELLQNRSSEKGQIFRLTFPYGVRSMLTVSELLIPKLMTICILKLRHYLSQSKNSEFVINKLYGTFSTKEQSVKDLLSKVQTQKDNAARTISDSDDFTFQFWTHFTSLITGEFKDKENKVDREHTYCQAAYLLSMYALFFRKQKKNKREKELALKSVEQKIQDEPFYHSFYDIYSFKDKNGLPISQKVDSRELSEYLQNKSAHKHNEPLPQLLRIKVEDEEYYIAKERLLHLILRRCHAISKQLRGQYEQEWAQVLGEFKKSPLMNRRELFQKDIWERVKQQDALLYSLLRYELIFLAFKETQPSREVYIETNRILNQKKSELVSIDEILRLDQRRIIHDARTYLPLWKSIPLVGRLGVVFGRLWKRLVKGAASLKDPAEVYSSFTKTREKPGAEYSAGESGKAPAKQPAAQGDVQGGASAGGMATAGSDEKKASGAKERQLAAGAKGRLSAEQKEEMRKALDTLKARYIGKGGNIDEELKNLIEKWNPLVAEQSKKNLIEDVNSAIRDFLRKLKRSLYSKPPDIERLQKLSAQIAEYEGFERIRDKESFRRYIELYMIKILRKNV